MDIKVTNVDVAYIKEIERKAKELSKNLGRNFSRNEYIKMLIQNDCELRLTQLKEDKFNHAVDLLTATLDRQEKTLQEFINSNTRLFHLMASGEDIGEGVDEL
ncbi:hypothetical protein DES36_11955 [Alkalibaculum bacchi]|uniref:Uncharacterized protein n=1 Tax=Alkalibaculum bacchi TaxID=645887 RepID=A0A366I028_9FIRM|nr:hypothetical protein [Alkalibaculum bacchi]RBP59330.1 hypothetical protein DES36_11955 [Alkalibaculum bacchi]